MAETVSSWDHRPYKSSVYSGKTFSNNNQSLTEVKSLSAIVTVDEVSEEDLAPATQPSLVTDTMGFRLREWPELEVKVCSIYLHLSGESTDTDELLIPVCATSPTGKAMFEAFNEANFHEYMAYRSVAEPWLFHEIGVFEDRCCVEWVATFENFPDISSRNVQLCMAAWMALKIYLQHSCQSFTAEDVKLAIGVVADMLNDFHEQSSPAETRRRMSHPSLFGLRHHTTQFRILFTELLTASAIAGLKVRIHESLIGIYEHALWRDTTQGDPKAYLTIKSRYSGLGPLFYLAHISTLEHSSPCSSTLESMQSLVSGAVALQKELVRIEDSLLDDSLDNYVLMTMSPSFNAVPLGLQLPCLGPSIRSSVKKHNKIVQDITKHHQYIHSNDKLQHERNSADMLVAFLGRHLEWKAGSMHYEVSRSQMEVQQPMDFGALGTLQKILHDLK